MLEQHSGSDPEGKGTGEPAPGYESGRAGPFIPIGSEAAVHGRAGPFVPIGSEAEVRGRVGPAPCWQHSGTGCGGTGEGETWNS